MRAIKFRGKEKDSGKWVYGFYVKHQTHTLAPLRPKEEEPEYQHLILKSGFSDWNMEKPLDMHEIDPETVGQFTGLHDKNGKEIYEGDILEIHHHYYGKTKTKVEFVAGMFQQYPMEKGMISTPLNQITLNCEIIGNKFENPELLGGVS